VERFQKQLLVLGLPRSGTQYLTLVLRNAGVKVGHEMFKWDGTVGMFFAVEDVFYPGQHWSTDDEQRQRRSDYQFEQVWHLTRDPRRVIPSIVEAMNPQLWVWQERHTGISCGLFPKTLRAMLFWVAWNELIEKNEEIAYRFRVEDIDAEWPTIRERLGIEADPEVPPVPRDYGHAKSIAPLSFEDMEAIDASTAFAVRVMSERYGYR
jgi:hypothetical protein